MRVLEINDIGLRLFEGEQLLLDSPGCAALDGRRLLTGDAAQHRSRLDPRRVNDRYWDELDAPLATPLGEARSAADLAYAQLAGLREPLTREPLLIAAPGSHSGAQLGVMLGVMHALGLRAVGLVDAAVAACSSVETPPQVLHVDVQRHRFVCTWIEGAGDVQRVRVEEHKPGFAALQDRCAAVIAEAFVRHARFDPLHDANTEQALYERLPDWIADLARLPSRVLEIASGSRTHRVSLTRETLEEAIAPSVRALADALLPQRRAHNAGVLISARAAALPGLVARLSPATVLDAAAAARGALQHRALIESDEPELPWVTRLPRSAHAAPVAPPVLRPTHALIGSRARGLPAPGTLQALSAWLPGAPGLLRHDSNSLRLEDVTGASLRVNGELLSGARALQAGDRIDFAGQELRLIEVEPARDDPARA